mmetsp:Transcript_55646/g.178533  ORF Transcript_55646/g.178533 Transcript_55646/m.178533 type:complete len:209 (+) Transcript_55646:1198-1824(+)
MRRRESKMETPGTKVMTITLELQSSGTGAGTRTEGKAARRLACTRCSVRASAAKSSSRRKARFTSSSVRSSSGLALLASQRIQSKSIARLAATWGFCTFTATSRPSAATRARCTWPRLAEPSGESSKWLKTSSRGRPSASDTRRRISAPGTAVTSLCNRLSSRRYSAGRPRFEKREQSWPSFTKSPPSSMSRCTSSRAYVAWSSEYAR